VEKHDGYYPRIVRDEGNLASSRLAPNVKWVVALFKSGFKANKDTMFKNSTGLSDTLTPSTDREIALVTAVNSGENS
jgi:hypothetical protein